VNKVILVGRLTRDPEVKNTMTGRAVATFTLAVDRRFKNKDGQKEADFIPIVFWGKQAELAGQYLSKGSQIGVSGRIQVRNYDAQDGTKRYVTEVVGQVDVKAVIRSHQHQNRITICQPWVWMKIFI
jgi:single-strand DNA-binding protein